MKRLGKQTLALDGECYILGRGSIAGKKEKDGNFIESPYRKGQCVMPEQPQYPAKWYETIAKDNGEILKVH